jgi:outer membrane protein OmpA-like peptidoglycan-associated protein
MKPDLYNLRIGARKSRLCMYGIGVAILSACAHKPAPTQPGPAIEKVNGAPTAIADAARGRGLSFDDFDKPFRARVSSIEYSPIYFVLNETGLSPEARGILEAVIEDAPGYRSCRIAGYTCPIGTTEYNQALGQGRAQTVFAYLRAADVRTSLQLISYGEERLATEDPAQYALNRRVVVECEK